MGTLKTKILFGLLIISFLMLAKLIFQNSKVFKLDNSLANDHLFLFDESARNKIWDNPVGYVGKNCLVTAFSLNKTKLIGTSGFIVTVLEIKEPFETINLDFQTKIKENRNSFKTYQKLNFAENFPIIISNKFKSNEIRTVEIESDSNRIDILLFQKYPNIFLGKANKFILKDNKNIPRLEFENNSKNKTLYLECFQKKKSTFIICISSSTQEIDRSVFDLFSKFRNSK